MCGRPDPPRPPGAGVGGQVYETSMSFSTALTPGAFQAADLDLGLHGTQLNGRLQRDVVRNPLHPGREADGVPLERTQGRLGDLRVGPGVRPGELHADIGGSNPDAACEISHRAASRGHRNGADRKSASSGRGKSQLPCREGSRRSGHPSPPWGERRRDRNAANRPRDSAARVRAVAGGTDGVSSAQAVLTQVRRPRVCRLRLAGDGRRRRPTGEAAGAEPVPRRQRRPRRTGRRRVNPRPRSRAIRNAPGVALDRAIARLRSEDSNISRFTAAAAGETIAPARTLVVDSPAVANLNRR